MKKKTKRRKKEQARPSNSLLCANLLGLREGKQWSWSELGRQAGMSKQAVKNIEEGKNSPSLDSLEKLAGAFGVTVRALVEAA